MIIIIFGVVLGIVLGALAPLSIPDVMIKYFAMGILAELDTIAGGLRAELEKQFDAKLFISGLIFNAVLAMLFTYIGNCLGIDISFAVIVVFGSRVFNNFSIIRRLLLQKEEKRVRIKKIDNLPPMRFDSEESKDRE